jgi:hypothetical protein
MKTWQFSIRWLMEVTVIACIYAVFVRGALYSEQPYRTNWQVLLTGLTIYIVLGTIHALATGTFFHDGGNNQRKAS